MSRVAPPRCNNGKYEKNAAIEAIHMYIHIYEYMYTHIYIYIYTYLYTYIGLHGQDRGAHGDHRGVRLGRLIATLLVVIIAILLLVVIIAILLLVIIAVLSLVIIAILLVVMIAILLVVIREPGLGTIFCATLLVEVLRRVAEICGDDESAQNCADKCNKSWLAKLLIIIHIILTILLIMMMMIMIQILAREILQV